MNTLAYFWAENARQSFTRAEILLYLYLNQNADSAGSLCRSTAQLAAALHLCTGTILRARKSLAARGLITLTKSPNRCMTYTFVDASAHRRVQKIARCGHSPLGLGTRRDDNATHSSPTPDGVDQPYSTPNRVENGDDGPSVARRVLNPTDYGHTALSLDHPHGGSNLPDSSDKSDSSDKPDALHDPSWQARISRNMHISPDRLAAAIDDYLASAPLIDDSNAARTQFLRWFNRRRRRL